MREMAKRGRSYIQALMSLARVVPFPTRPGYGESLPFPIIFFGVLPLEMVHYGALFVLFQVLFSCGGRLNHAPIPPGEAVSKR